MSQSILTRPSWEVRVGSWIVRMCNNISKTWNHFHIIKATNYQKHLREFPPPSHQVLWRRVLEKCQRRVVEETLQRVASRKGCGGDYTNSGAGGVRYGIEIKLLGFLFDNFWASWSLTHQWIRSELRTTPQVQWSPPSWKHPGDVRHTNHQKDIKLNSCAKLFQEIIEIKRSTLQ